MKPQFVTLEGVEGAGKSTQKTAICAWLSARGVSFVETREPGGTPLAESIRTLLLHTDADPPHCIDGAVVDVRCARTTPLNADSDSVECGSLGNL